MKKFALLIIICSLFLISCTKVNPEANFSFTAVITSIGEEIEVNITESEYLEGVCILLIDKAVIYKNDEKILKKDLQIGDKIEIHYTGQVMLSYPPKVNAITIKVIK